MIRSRAFVCLLALAVGSLGLAMTSAGCGGKKPPEVAVAPPVIPPPPPAPAAPPTPPPPPAPRPAAPPATPPPPATLTEEQIFARKSLDQLNSEKPLSDAFFDLDESTIREDAKPMLQRNAEWMKRWASTQVSVEGHCDSRGSSEYNLALGSRRAEAIKQYMISLGVPATRLTVISKGKEQPFCSDEGESCWQQNRRGHFIVSAK